MQGKSKECGCDHQSFARNDQASLGQRHVISCRLLDGSPEFLIKQKLLRTRLHSDFDLSCRAWRDRCISPRWRCATAIADYIFNALWYRRNILNFYGKSLSCVRHHFAEVDDCSFKNNWRSGNLFTRFPTTTRKKKRNRSWRMHASIVDRRPCVSSSALTTLYSNHLGQLCALLVNNETRIKIAKPSGTVTMAG